MSLIIQDQEADFTADNTPTGIDGPASVTARPNVSPFWVKSGATFVQDLSRLRTAFMDSNHNWFLILPWPSESNPTTVQWTIIRTDGTALYGTIPEGVSGPVTLSQLLNSYGWSYVTLPITGGPVSVIQGPPGVNWRGPWSSTTQYGTNDGVSYGGSSWVTTAPSLNILPGTGSWDLLAEGGAQTPATSTTLGNVLLDQNPVSGNPIALTVPSLGLVRVDQGGALQLQPATPLLQWATDDSINRSDTLTLQPYGANKNGSVNIAPSGNAALSSLTLFTGSNVNVGGQPIFAFGGGISGARPGTWAFGSVVLSSLNVTSQDIAFITSGVSYGRAENLTLQASSGNVGINNTNPASAQLSVVNRTPGQVGAIVKSAAGQSASIQEWQDSTGGVLAKVDAGGVITALRGFINDQTTTSTTLQVQGNATSGTLLQVGTSALNRLLISPADSQFFGSVYIEGPNGAQLNVDPNAFIVQSYLRRIDLYSANGYAITLNARPGYLGNKVGVGTLSPSGLFHVSNTTASVVGIVAQGAAGQTADLQQWQDSTGGVLVRLGASGDIHIGTTGSTTSTPRLIEFVTPSGTAWRIGDGFDGLQNGSGQRTQLFSYWGLMLQGNIQNNLGAPAYVAGTTDTFGVLIPTARASDIGLIVQGSAGQSADLQQWQDSTGGVQARITSAGYRLVLSQIQAGTNNNLLSLMDQLGSEVIRITSGVIMTNAPFVALTGAGSVPLIAKGAASQTADLQQWQNNAGTVLAVIDKAGRPVFASNTILGTAAAGANAGTTPPAPSLFGNDIRGEIWFGTGTGPTAGTQVTVTFNQALPNNAVVFIQPINAAAQALGVYCGTGTSTQFTVDTANAPAVSQVNTTYKVRYLVVG